MRSIETPLGAARFAPYCAPQKVGQHHLPHRQAAAGGNQRGGATDSKHAKLRTVFLPFQDVATAKSASYGGTRAVERGTTSHHIGVAPSPALHIAKRRCVNPEHDCNLALSSVQTSSFSVSHLTEQDLEPRDWILLLAKQQALFARELFTRERKALDWLHHECTSSCKFASMGAWMVCATSGSVHVCKSEVCNMEIQSAFHTFCPLSGRTRTHMEAQEEFCGENDEAQHFAPNKEITTSNGALHTAPTGMPGERELIRMQRVKKEDNTKAKRLETRTVDAHTKSALIESNNEKVNLLQNAELLRMQAPNAGKLQVTTKHSSEAPEIKQSNQQVRELVFIAPPKARNRSRTIILKAQDSKEQSRKTKTQFELTQLALRRARELMPPHESPEVLQHMAQLVVDLWYSLQGQERFLAYASRYTFAQHVLASLFGMQQGITKLHPTTNELVVLLPKVPAASERMMKLNELIAINNLHKKRPKQHPAPPFLPRRVTDASRILKLFFKQRFEPTQD